MASLGFSVKMDNTLGAAFIGFAGSCAVYGILSTQVWTYYHQYPHDRRLYKWLVAALWVLTTVDQCFIGHVVYHYTITEYLNPLALTVERPVWSLILQLTIGVIVGFIVKIAFAIRVWRFSSHNYVITAILLALSTAQLAFALLYTVRSFMMATLIDLPSLKVVASLSLGAGLVTDVCTSAALCFYLQKLRTGYSKSDSLVNGLTLYAVNTGVLTSAFSLATLVTYDLLPGTFIFMSFYFVMSKLYAVSFLATLNTRSVIRGRGTDQEDPTQNRNTFYMYGQSGGAPRMQGIDMPQSPTEIQMKVDVHQEVSVISDVPYYSSNWKTESV